VSELALRLALLLIWAAVVSLDERAYGSLMLHQPLVSGSVAGALMGNLQGGMTAGLVFQCFWPALLPVGGAALPAAGLAGVVAGAITGWGSHLARTRALGSIDGPLLFGVLFGLLVAGTGQHWERLTRVRNAGREERALSSSGPLRAALERAMRASYHETALRGLLLAGGALFLASMVYLWPAGVRWLGRAPWPQWGASLRLTALGLGLGVLSGQLQEGRRRIPKELVWGLAAGVGLQILRAL
jgi:hypothetical protein